MKYIAFVVLLLASPALAQNADDVDVVAMTNAIEAAGCTVTAENGDAVLEASGLTEEETMDVIATMYANGAIALEADGSMSLFSEVCQ